MSNFLKFAISFGGIIKRWPRETAQRAKWIRSAKGGMMLLPMKGANHEETTSTESFSGL